MKQNTHEEFVGVAPLKRKHKEQLTEFESWASRNEWEKFHHAHYDWWIFPVNRQSSYGYQWTVYASEVEELKADPAFVADYLRGMELVAASWGWDLKNQGYFSHLQPGQSWHDWPIRLAKAAQSAQVFGFENEFASLKALALDLVQKGKSLVYNGRDYIWLFTTGIDPYAGKSS